MRIGVYTERVGGLGGGEYVAAVLAHAYRHADRVELVHHDPDLTIEQLETFTGLTLDRLSLRWIHRQSFRAAGSSPEWLGGRGGRQWERDLSAPYDLFVNVTHSIPPHCYAAAGVLLVLFPLFNRNAAWPANDPATSLLDVRRHVRNRYYDWRWRQRISSYRRVVAISEFTRTWTQRYWGIDSTIVYPPVGQIAAGAHKTNSILNVGRFAVRGHRKRQPEVIRAFGELPGLRAQGWLLECIGSVGTGPEDLAYFDDVNALATTNGVRLLANVTRDELIGRYQAASVFVHAAGYDEPADRPELMEHFGISTVEAMSAGCVPIVINRGGQPEIVQHGVNGFVWNTLDELKEYLTLVARDADLRHKLATAAVRRARFFRHDRFVDEMTGVIGTEFLRTRRA
jgi:glycosyltransferase involved in cell wall biosynthesis